MLNKKLMILTIFFVSLLAVSAVSAADNATEDIVGVKETNDVNDMAIASEDQDVIEIENQDSADANMVTAEVDNEKIASNVISSSNEDILNEQDNGTFTALQEKIDYADENATITLENDYTYDEGFSTGGIKISKPLTIDGKGFTIDAKSKSRVFYLSNKVTIKNIKFQGGYSTDFASAIEISGGTCDIISCSFTNCSSGFCIASWLGHYNIIYCNFTNCSGGVMNTQAVCNITSCIFTNCSSLGAISNYPYVSCHINSCNFITCSNKNGGAIYNYHALCTIYSCVFNDCYAENNGGAIYNEYDEYDALAGDKCNITLCIFTKCFAMNNIGNAIYNNCTANDSNCTVTNCNFTDLNKSEAGYNASFINCTFKKNAAKIQTTIITSAVTMVKGEGKYQSIILEIKDNSTPLKNKTIIITIDDLEDYVANYTTDSMGEVKAAFSFLNVGQYIETIKFAGDDDYKAVSKKVLITVTENSVAPKPDTNTSQNTTISDDLQNDDLSFKNLSDEIRSDKVEITLEHDYKYDSNIDSNYKTISISSGKSIDGKDHYIDGNNQFERFNIYSNVVLKNIKFKNFYSKSSTLFSIVGNNCTFNNCTFENMFIKNYGYIINEYVINTTIINCNFINNTASYIIDMSGENTQIIESNFTNNTISSYVIYVSSSSENCKVIGCRFDNNSGDLFYNSGGDCYCDNGIYDFDIHMDKSCFIGDPEGDSGYLGDINYAGSKSGNISVLLNGVESYNRKINYHSISIYGGYLTNIPVGIVNMTVLFVGDDGSRLLLYDGAIDLDYYFDVGPGTDWEDDDYGDEIIYYDYGVFYVCFPRGVTGDLSVSYGNIINNTLNYNKESYYPRANFKIYADDFSIGPHNITVSLTNDPKFCDKTVQYTFYVSPKVIVPDCVSVGENEFITLEFPDNFKGKVTVYNGSYIEEEIDEEYYYSYNEYCLKDQIIASADVVNGQVKIPVNNLVLGGNVIIINCTGDGDFEDYYFINYIQNSPKFNSRIDSDVIEAGNSVILRINAPKSSEELCVYVDEELYKDVSLDKTEITEYISNLNLGEHKIKLLYSERAYDEYTNRYRYVALYSNSFYVTVVEPNTSQLIKTKITSSNVNMVYGEEKYLVATLKDSSNNTIKDAEISITLNGQIHKINTDSNGRIQYRLDLAPKTYIATLSYAGNEVYQSTQATVNIVVNKIDCSNVEIPQSVTNRDGILSVSFPSGTSGTLTLILNRNYTSAIINSKADFDLSELSDGRYDYTITYSGDSAHAPFTKSGTFNINRVLSIDSTDAVVNYGDANYYSATFYDSDGSLLKDKYVVFKVNNVEIPVKTDSNGVATLNVQLDPGEYNITTVNPKTDEEKVTKLTVKVNQRAISENEIRVPSFSNGEGAITLPNDASGSLILDIAGMKFSYQVVNGVANIRLPKLANGVYGYILNYSGDVRYNPFLKTRILTLNTPTQTTSPVNTQAKTTIALKAVKVKKSAKKLILQATLKQGNSPIKNKKVTFKFNGKTYKAKTNKNGVAKVTISKKMLKKLKVGKKVKYQASYGKVTAKKTAKVKK